MDDLISFKEKFHKKYQTNRWSTVEECAILVNLIEKNKINQVVEIGTANGWTASWMSLASPVFTVDVSDRTKIYDHSEFPHYIRKFPIHFVKSSIQVVDLNWLKLHTVLFFIDGDHKRISCKKDFNAIIPYAKPKDIVVLHDSTREHGVQSFVRALKKNHSDLYSFEQFDTYNGMTLVRKK